MDQEPPSSNADATAEPSPRRFGTVRRRLPVYALLLVLGLVGTSAALYRDPQTEVDALASVVVDNAKPKAFYRYRGASVGMYGRHGYSLTLYVGGTERFAPARYLIISRIDGHLQGELLKHDGARGVSRLTGARLETYLARCKLDLSGIERAHAAWLLQATGAAKR